MAFNKRDNDNAQKHLQSQGFRTSTSDKSKMIHDSGKTAKLSDSGGSWTVDNKKYTDLSDLKKR